MTVPIPCFEQPGEMGSVPETLPWFSRCGCGVVTCERGTPQEAQDALNAHQEAKAREWNDQHPPAVEEV